MGYAELMGISIQEWGLGRRLRVSRQERERGQKGYAEVGTCTHGRGFCACILGLSFPAALYTCEDTCRWLWVRK